MPDHIEQLKNEINQLQAETGSQSNAPQIAQPVTDDFKSFVLWWTWKKRGTSEFDEWLETEGTRLTKLNDQRCLDAIAKLKADPHDDLTDMMIRFNEHSLSWKYAVSPQFRQHSSSFRIIEG